MSRIGLKEEDDTFWSDLLSPGNVIGKLQEALRLYGELRYVDDSLRLITFRQANDVTPLPDTIGVFTCLDTQGTLILKIRQSLATENFPYHL